MHTRLRNSHRPHRVLGPDTLPAPSPALPCWASEFEGCGQKEHPVGSRPHSSTCSAGPPALGAPGPSETRGECPQRPGSLEVVQLLRSRGGVLTWGPRRQECAGCPQDGEVRGRRACGRPSPRCLPGARRVAPRSSARDRERRVRVPPARPGQRQSAELAALPLLFLRRGARSGGGWVGAEGRGGGRGGPRGAAARRGLRRSRVRVCGPGHPLGRSRAEGWGPREAGWGDGQRKAF